MLKQKKEEERKRAEVPIYKLRDISELIFKLNSL